MRRSVLSVLSVLSLASTSVLHAQSTARAVGLSLSGGLSQPIGELADFAESGFQLSAGVWIRPSRFARLSFTGDLSYDRFALDVGTLGAANGVSAQTRVLGGRASAKYLLGAGTTSTIRPYVIGGLGLYNVKDATTQNGESGESPGQTKLGLHGGAGLDVRLSGFSTFIEARVHNLLTDGQGLNRSRGSMRYVPIVFGVRF